MSLKIVNSIFFVFSEIWGFHGHTNNHQCGFDHQRHSANMGNRNQNQTTNVAMVNSTHGRSSLLSWFHDFLDDLCWTSMVKSGHFLSWLSTGYTFGIFLGCHQLFPQLFTRFGPKNCHGASLQKWIP